MASSGASKRRLRWFVATALVLVAVVTYWFLNRDDAASSRHGQPVGASEPLPVPSPPPEELQAATKIEAPATAQRSARDEVSAPAPPTLAEQRLPGGTRFYGSVVEAKGAPPVREGAHCELAAVPVVGVAGECRVFLECEGHILHGAPIRHPVRCTSGNDGMVQSVTDELTSARDVDAALSVAAGGETIDVSDERPGEYGQYTMRITVDSVERGR